MPQPQMSIRQALAERARGRRYFLDLPNTDRWALGDQLVLGDVDYLEWFGKRPSAAFLNGLDEARIEWEITCD